MKAERLPAVRTPPDLREPIPVLTEAIDVDFGVHQIPPLLTEVVDEALAALSAPAAPAFADRVRNALQRRRA